MARRKDPWPCRACNNLLVPAHTWVKMPKPRPYRQHHAQGLCAPCWRRWKRTGEVTAPVQGRPALQGTRPCADCDRSCYSQSQVRRMTDAEKDAAKADGLLLGYYRRLCFTCYRKRRDNNTLMDVERTTRPWADVVADWEELADPRLPIKPQVRELAPRIGVSPWALERALLRSGVRSQWGDGGWKRKDGAT